VVLAAAGAAGAALAQEAPAEPVAAPMEGATITDAGWWNRSRAQLALPTGQPPAPPTPGVPAGSLVAGASVGDPDAVTAVGIDLESPPGATVERFELTLREVPDEGANLNSTFAALVACPATGFWIGGENGVWETRPAHDCSLGEAPGTRADDGTWSFDLTAIAQGWSDGVLDPNGVVLVEDVEAPTGFRAVFAGLDALAVGVRAATSGGDEPPTPTTRAASGSRAPSVTRPGSAPAGAGGGIRPPAAGTSVPPTAPPTTGAAEVAVDVPAVRIAGEAPSPLGSIPWWSWPMLAAALVLGLLAMFALGPAGEPVTASTGRGVTRALEARMSPEES